VPGVSHPGQYRQQAWYVVSGIARQLSEVAYGTVNR
jgi:hypothetical protein